MTKWIWDKKFPETWVIDKEIPQKSYFFGQIYTCHAHNSSKRVAFDLIASKDWVQCLALTSKNELILVSQFRPGKRSLSLEIPGGGIEKDEDPTHALHRELREESGYTGYNPVLLYSGYANPATFNCHVYFYMMQNCKKTHPTDFDPTEDCATYLLPLDQLDNAICDGLFENAVTLTGLLLFQRWLLKHSL